MVAVYVLKFFGTGCCDFIRYFAMLLGPPTPRLSSSEA